jgi:two-component system sensor kinase FixL
MTKQSHSSATSPHDLESLKARVAELESDLTHTQDALRQANTRFESFAANSADYVMLVDADGSFQYINRTEPGYRREDVIGTPIFDFLREPDVSVLRQCMAKVVETLHPDHCVLDYQSVDGRKQIFETRISPILQDGKLVSLALIGRNETTHYEVARSLLDREQRLRVLVEQLPAILWTTDRNLVFTSSQGAGLKAMGLRTGQVIGMPISDFLGSGNDSENAIAMHRQALNGESSRFEVNWSERSYDVYVEPFRNSDGEIVGVIGVAVDITKRILAERNLKDNERLLSDSQRFTRIGSWDWDIEGGITKWSDETYRILGLSDKEAPLHFDDYVEQYVHEDDRDDVVQSISTALSSKQKTSVEYRIIRPDGECRVLWTQGRVFRNPEGRATRIVGTVQDITEKRQVEFRLQERLQFEELLNSLSADLASVTGAEKLDDVIGRAVERTSRFLGVERGLVFQFSADRQYILCTHEWHAQHVPSAIGRLACQSCRRFPWVINTIADQGTLVVNSVAELHEEATRDRDQLLEHDVNSLIGITMCAGGETIGFICFDSIGVERSWSSEFVERLRLVGDIVANALSRKRIDDALRRTHRQLEHLTASVSDGLWSVRLSLSGSWLDHYHSPVMERITGRPFGFFQNCPEQWMSIVHAEDRLRVRQALDRVSAGEPIVDEQEYRIILPNGEVRWVRDSAVARRQEDGSIRLDGVLSDVTDRREAEEQSRRHHDELAHVGRLSTMGELVASIAHEVNQPLYAITNYAGACQNFLLANADGQMQQIMGWTQEISDQARRAGEIIKRLGNFVRKSPPFRSALDINELVVDSVRLLEFEARRQEVRVDWHLPEIPTMTLADRVQIQQVLVNLLRNAFDAMQDIDTDKRQVSILGKKVGEKISVYVRDRGNGFRDEDASQLFETFFTTKEEGMGMGLAISRSIIEAHDGRLWGENHPDGGAVFAFEIPVRKTLTQPAWKRRSHSRQPDDSGENGNGEGK